ncbi:DNA-binding protein [Halobacterium jilantaiense]|uniref:DNA-binding protein SAMN04487945_2283 n=1 Tax=Halobacterium jilantaiense TaxID=355548 RepID=A0A1I0Q584_9EURY|nr:DNA-binding protein [Halobacterium jilantaiense]SEW22047.1 DNA-binding TFAR19-related protein [Halobacterium jilantaiense]
MSGNPDDERLEELRKQKKEQLKQQQQGGGDGQREAQQQAQQQAEQQKQALLKQNLTDGARKRLNTIRMSKPEFAEKVEQQVVALAQSGRLQERIDEDQMKELLRELKPDSQSFNINRR